MKPRCSNCNCLDDKPRSNIIPSTDSNFSCSAMSRRAEKFPWTNLYSASEPVPLSLWAATGSICGSASRANTLPPFKVIASDRPPSPNVQSIYFFPLDGSIKPITSLSNAGVWKIRVSATIQPPFKVNYLYLYLICSSFLHFYLHFCVPLPLLKEITHDPTEKR